MKVSIRTVDNKELYSLNISDFGVAPRVDEIIEKHGEGRVETYKVLMVIHCITESEKDEIKLFVELTKIFMVP